LPGAADCTEFPDDSSIANDVALLRRIPDRHFHFDQNERRWRPSSAAFEDDEDGDPMSVYRKDLIDLEGGDVRRVMAGHPGFALASLTAGQVRSRNQTVSPRPLPEESSHVGVCGPKPKSVTRWFAKAAEWVISPPVS
jgi:hypothetical protein